jgi:hypothetical protein
MKCNWNTTQLAYQPDIIHNSKMVDAYQGVLCRLMAYLHDVDAYEKYHLFWQAKLVALTPNHIKRWMCEKAHGTPEPEMINHLSCKLESYSIMANIFTFKRSASLLLLWAGRYLRRHFRVACVLTLPWTIIGQRDLFSEMTTSDQEKSAKSYLELQLVKMRLWTHNW